MVTRITVLVEAGELADLFSALELFDKIGDGRLSSTPIEATRRPTTEPGGEKLHVKHLNTSGFHVCTTHQVFDATGSRIHWDGSDVMIGDVLIAKRSLEYLVAAERRAVREQRQLLRRLFGRRPSE